MNVENIALIFSHSRPDAFMLKAFLSQSRLRTSGALPIIMLLLVAAAVAFADSPASAGSAQWTKQKSNTLAWLHAIYFLDGDIGWAVGGNGALLSTHDGGATWRTSPRPTEDALRDLYFSDTQNGWLVCDRSIYKLKTNDEPRTYLLRTTNGGAAWQRVEVTSADPAERLVRVVFADNKTGWAFGEAGAVYTTRDGGESWARQLIPTRRLLLGGSFIGQNQGWLVGAGATILQTSDGGETWRAAFAGGALNARLNAVSFVDKMHGWAVGAEGIILSTRNGGNVWRKQISNVATDLNDVKFIDEAEGWAVGAEGVLLHTTNGGGSWTIEHSGTTHPLERLYLIGRARGWAVGFGGTIINYGVAGNLSAPRAPQLKTIPTH